MFDRTGDFTGFGDGNVGTLSESTPKAQESGAVTAETTFSLTRIFESLPRPEVDGFTGGESAFYNKTFTGRRSTTPSPIGENTVSTPTAKTSLAFKRVFPRSEGFTGSEQPFYSLRARFGERRKAVATPSVESTAVTPPSSESKAAVISPGKTVSPAFYLPEWIEREVPPTTETKTPVEQVSGAPSQQASSSSSKEKTASSPSTPESHPLQIIARTCAVAPISTALTPFERTQRKLMGKRAAGINTNFWSCFGEISQNQPFKGISSKWSSNIVKSGTLFIVQYVVGGSTGFAMGGVVQGMATTYQQVLDHRLAKNPEAKFYRDVIRKEGFRSLWQNAKIPCAIGGVQGGVFLGSLYLFSG